MKKILLSLSALGLQFLQSQTVPLGSIIAYYPFEQTLKDSSANIHDLRSFSIKTGNDTVYGADQFFTSRIQNQFAYKKSEKIQGCNFVPYCDTLTKLEAAESPNIVNNSTDGFSLSYWVFNRTGVSSSYSRHLNIFDSISAVQFSSHSFDLISGNSHTMTNIIYDKFGFEATPFSSSGNGYYTAFSNNSLQSNSSQLSWKNVIYTFSKTDSTIRSYGNGSYLGSWKLNNYSYNYVFTKPFHIVVDQIGGISPQNSNILARAVDDIILFNKVLDLGEISAIQNYPQAPTFTGINDEPLNAQSNGQIQVNNGLATIELSTNELIQSIDIYNIQGSLLASYSRIHKMKYEFPVSTFCNGLNIAKITLENGRVFSSKVVTY